MTFLELQTAFYQRGFDYLDQDAVGRVRAKAWLNEAYVADICDPYPWPFLETTATGAAPLTVSNAKDVLYVTDTTNQARLTPTDLRDIIDRNTNPATTGRPDSYYFDGTSVKVYPVATPSLSIRYIKVPTELSADADTPLVPTRYQQLIVDGAAIRGYQDSDNFEAVSFLQGQFDARLLKMADSLFSGNLDETQYVRRAMAHDG